MAAGGTTETVDALAGRRPGGAATALVGLFLALAWLLIVALTLGQQLLGARIRGMAPDPATSLVLISGWIGVALVAAPSLPVLRRSLDHTGPSPPGLLPPILFGGALAFTLAYGSATALAVRALVPGRASMEAGDLLLRSWLSGAPASLLAFLATAGVVQAACALDRRRRVEVEASRLDALLTEARLDALKARLRPHFLFNALNAVTALVRDGQTREAARALELLGRLLRTALRHERRQRVLLEDELRLVADYLGLERLRFGNRLRVRWDVDEDAGEASVPSFLLLPLVENAVTHGLESRSGGRIRIAARSGEDGLRIEVEDDGPGPESGTAGTREGLAQTRERLRALHGPRAQVELRARRGGGTVATVLLPGRGAREVPREDVPGRARC